MRKIEITAFELAQRYSNIKEVAGNVSNPLILAMLKLDQKWPDDDKVPWCSAFMNWICWNLRLPRSKSLRARSWLLVGEEVDANDMKVGFDVVILKRGAGSQPGPEVIKAPGHVGFFAGWSTLGTSSSVLLLGGNQSDSVNVSPYDSNRILGVRRLYS
jgi:uncharacterized protein (TIGR02594 family)